MGRIVTSDLLAAALTGQKAIFQKQLGESEAQYGNWKSIATVMQSEGPDETYSWLGDIPVMREWTDEREVQGLKGYNYTLTNKHYEATIKVNRDTYEDDRLGQIPPRIKALANAALRHQQEMVFSKLDDGETDTCFDSSAFFGDSRTIGDSGTIDNLLAGAYSGSVAEIRNGMRAAVYTMAQYKSDKGQYLNLVPNWIVCHPVLTQWMHEALDATVSGVARRELDYFSHDRILSTPWLDLDGGGLDWYVLYIGGPVNPIIFQERKKPEFVAVTNITDSRVMMNNEFIYGVDGRFTVGYGDPRTAIKMKDA